MLWSSSLKTISKLAPYLECAASWLGYQVEDIATWLTVDLGRCEPLQVTEMGLDAGDGGNHREGEKLAEKILLREERGADRIDLCCLVVYRGSSSE